MKLDATRLKWFKSRNLQWARIGQLSISIKRWRARKGEIWSWRVHEIFGRVIVEYVAYPTPEAAQRMALSYALYYFNQVQKAFRAFEATESAEVALQKDQGP